MNTTTELCRDRLHELNFIWLEITARCNLSCVHCYAESGPRAAREGAMTYDDWTGVLGQAYDLGCRSVQFIGGEPTEYPRLADLLKHASDVGFTFMEVFTNATALTAKLIDCFVRQRVHVAVSFYADDPLIHDRVTLVPGSWRRTIAGIDAVISAGLPIRVCVIETGQNAGHLARARTFLQSHGVSNIQADRKRGVGRGSTHSLGGDERFDELCGRCWRGLLCVTSARQVFPCVFSRRTMLGDVSTGLSEIVRTAKLAQFRNAVQAMSEARARSRGRAGQLHMDCLPSHCSPEDCSPENCMPEDCMPEECKPEEIWNESQGLNVSM